MRNLEIQTAPPSVVLARTLSPNYESGGTIAALDALLETAELPPLVKGRRVLIKPNWVMHQNGSGMGLECLITHPLVVETIARSVLCAGAEQVIVADAPVQACDFARLSAACAFPAVLDRLRRHGDIEIRDLRLATRAGTNVWSNVTASARRLDAYVEFDLGTASWLEPVTGSSDDFRVTCYDPAELRKTHGPGKHRYLVAMELIDAEVVINVPKLKTHRKAGMTGALKNLVGINGHKSYLPHHRRGALSEGGDCYEHSAALKRVAEFALDRANGSPSTVSKYAWGRFAGWALAADRSSGGNADVEGSWHGNDTVWRMALDLYAIAQFGTAHGSLASTPQRILLNITDAVIAGEGNGPLCPEPAPLGFFSMAEDPGAADWINALLLGLDPRRIPTISHYFAQQGLGHATFSPGEIQVQFDGLTLTWPEAAPMFARDVRVPPGWVGRCEWCGERSAAC